MYFIAVVFLSLIYSACGNTYGFDTKYAETLLSGVNLIMASPWSYLETVASSFRSEFTIPRQAYSPDDIFENMTFQLLYSLLRPASDAFSGLYVGFSTGKYIGYTRNYGMKDPNFPAAQYMRDSNSSCMNFSQCLGVYDNLTKPSNGLILKRRPTQGFKYDVTARPWYKGALNDASHYGTFWTQPYVFVDGYGMTAAKQLVTATETIIGVTGIDYKLPNPAIQRLMVATGDSFSFLVDRDGYFIAGSNTSHHLQGNQLSLAENSRDKLVSQFALHFNSLQGGYRNVSIQMILFRGSLYWGKSAIVRDNHGLELFLVTCQRVDCPSHHHADARGNCIECIDPLTASGGSYSQDCDFCIKGFYFGLDGTCHLCPRGMECKGGNIETIKVHVGWYRFTSSSPHVYRCPYKDHCPGMNYNISVNDTEYECRRGTKGPLCSECASRFYFDLSSLRCEECQSYVPSSSAIAMLVVISLGLMLACLILMRRFFSCECWKVIEKTTRSRAKSVEAVASSKSSKSLYRTARILYVFYQLVSGFQYILLEHYSRQFQNSLTFFSFFHLDFWRIFPFDCLSQQHDYLDSMLMATLIPILLSVFLFLRHAYSKEDNTIYFRLVIGLLFVILPGTCSSIFGSFRCDEYSIDEDNTIRYLAKDYSIKCNSPRYLALNCTAALMILVYPIGVPSFFAILLWRDRYDLIDPLVSVEIGRKGSAFSAKYNRSSVATALGTFFLGNAARGVVKDYDDDDELKQEDWADIIKEHRLSFLLSSYKRRTYWFEVIETLRRLSLSGFLALFQPGSTRQIAVGCVFSLFFLRLYSFYLPLLGTHDNALAEMCNWQLFSILFITLLLNVGEAPRFAGIILLTILYVSVLFMVYVLSKSAQAIILEERSKTWKSWKKFFDSSVESGLHEVNNSRVDSTENLSGIELCRDTMRFDENPMAATSHHAGIFAESSAETEQELERDRVLHTVQIEKLTADMKWVKRTMSVNVYEGNIRM